MVFFEGQNTQGNTLQNVPNISVLTASSSVRTSFGCGADELRTYFGESYFESLKSFNKNKTFNSIDWQELHKKNKEKVLYKEKELKIDSKHFSNPQFFSNMKN